MQGPRGMERLAVEQRLRHRDVRQRDIAVGDAVENKLVGLGQIERIEGNGYSEESRTDTSAVMPACAMVWYGLVPGHR
jgi:hypothetical protein